MENKNFIIAVVLSVAVMFIWSSFFAPQPAPQAEETVNNEVPAPKEENKTPPEITVSETQAGSAKPAIISDSQIRHPEKTGTIKNDSLELTYSSVSGKITKSLIIKEKYLSKNVDLSEAMAESHFFPEMSSVFGSEPDYEIESASGSSVTFKYENGGVTETKTISLLEDFKLSVSKSITNNTAGSVEWTPSISLNSLNENQDILSSYNRKFNIVAQKKSGTFDELEDTKDIEEYFSTGKEVEWIGINYGYFIFVVLSPDEPLSASATIDSSKNLSGFIAESKGKVLQPGEMHTREFTIFYGTKERDLLKKENMGLEKTITFGWTGFLAEPLLLALNFFNEYVGNYGLAIIFLTIVVKLLLFPLSNASYKSMSKMRALQPKIKELQEKYKKDKETLNKETMLLYQKEGVNPLGGCLPMFIQMPVYIALYYMIQNAVELYNAPFLPFWLTDLSEKDPFYIIPVSLGLLMFLQTKLTPQTMDNAQAKIMMYTMPVVFTWISLVLPSGMTLYWFVNTLLGIAQQMYVNKKYS